MRICTQEDTPSKPESGSPEEGRGEGLKLSGSGDQHGHTAGQPGVAEEFPPPTQLDAHLEVFNPGFRKLHAHLDKAERLSLDLGKRALSVRLSFHRHEAHT